MRCRLAGGRHSRNGYGTGVSDGGQSSRHRGFLGCGELHRLLVRLGDADCVGLAELGVSLGSGELVAGLVVGLDDFVGRACVLVRDAGFVERVRSLSPPPPLCVLEDSELRESRVSALVRDADDEVPGRGEVVALRAD